MKELDELLEYIKELQTGDIELWNESARRGYILACKSIEEKIKELNVNIKLTDEESSKQMEDLMIDCYKDDKEIINPSDNYDELEKSNALLIVDLTEKVNKLDKKVYELTEKLDNEIYKIKGN